MEDARHDLVLSWEEHVERAGLDPDGRPASVRRALEEAIRLLPVAGTALIRPRMDGAGPWWLEYAGEREAEMLRWLSARLDDSYEVMAYALKERPPHMPEAPPMLLPISSGPFAKGLWVLWPRTDDPRVSLKAERLGDLRRGLEALLEVEHKERLYFRSAESPLEPQLREAIANGDSQALPALLNIAKLVTEADFTYWGEVTNDLLKVAWHLGAPHTDFGFELPVGEGIGGRAFGDRKVFHVTDYLNCQYRYPGVSDIADRQEIRTVLVAPVYGWNSHTGAALFGVRRNVVPFTYGQRLLLIRLARGVEPVPGGRLVSRFFFPSNDTYMAEKRSELRQILLRSNQVRDIEAWLERLVRGPAILTDAEGCPYVLGNADRFERLRGSSTASGAPAQTVKITAPGTDERGHLHIWPSLSVPPPGWPDFLDDVTAACNVVIDRTERENDRLNRKRSQWLGEVLEQATPQLRREGYHLGLSVDRGEVWALAWTRQTFEIAKQARLKLLIQDIALDQLSSPLVLTDDDIGIFLLGGPARNRPSVVRDALLRVFGPAPLWLVHGASYDSFEGLKGSLLRAIGTIKRIRHENGEQYVSDVSSRGLDSFLANPELSGHLDTFTDNLFEPLIAYDADTNSQLTETLTLALTVATTAEVAKRLHVHPKTVKYRIRRAEQILGKNLDSPTDRTALNMAAFVWARRSPNRFREASSKPD